jgi:hypothetical protein
MTAGGTWTYTVDNTHATVQALNVGQSLTDTFTVATIDGTTQQVTITIHGADDAPVVTAPDPANFNASSGQPGSIGTGIALHDVDSANLSGATVAITGGFNSGDVLAANTSGTSIHASYDAVHGILTLSGTDTVSDYQQVLASVTIRSTQSQNNTATISWQVSDQNNLASEAVTSEVGVTGVVAPPPLFADNHTTPPSLNVTPASFTNNGDRSFQLSPPAGGDLGLGTSGLGYSVVHTDPVLTTASDDTVQINLNLAALETTLGGDVVSVVARQANGDPLPDWLKFDPATGKFAGLPPEGAIASIEPASSSDNDVVTGSLPPKPDDGVAGPYPATPHTITIEVLARDSKGNVAVTVFTIDLQIHSAGKQSWNAQPFGGARHASLPMRSPELAAIEAAVRDATRPLEPFALRGLTGGHGDAISTSAAETATAGRAGLTEQLASVGWRSMAAQRDALLASLQQR